MTKAAQAQLIAELTAALKAALPIMNGNLAGSAYIFDQVREAIANAERQS